MQNRDIYVYVDWLGMNEPLLMGILHRDVIRGKEIFSFDTDRKWLGMLIAPGSSLGGARPKANILYEQGNLWIAKFPSGNDSKDMGAWEMVVN